MGLAESREAARLLQVKEVWDPPQDAPEEEPPEEAERRAKEFFDHLRLLHHLRRWLAVDGLLHHLRLLHHALLNRLRHRRGCHRRGRCRSGRSSGPGGAVGREDHHEAQLAGRASLKVEKGR